ncbi:MAG: hypothetical protein Q8S73_32315 [Deltaproteobacteria bacterium]|nr:hypothetical protein [Myxococcales bacterium]MDP3218830.1 hypothetical protein [Deltaproteobacteria bacterium]
MSKAKSQKVTARTTTAKTTVAKTTTARDPDVPVVDGSQAAYDTFLPDALQIPAAEVRPFRYDASLAYHNVTRGLVALQPHIATLRAELPRTDADALADLPDLALAVLFAADQVDRGADRSDGNTARLLKRAFASRTLLLDAATALAGKGLLPKRAVAKIREGRGNIDAASDCVALVALFQKHAANVKGRHALSRSDLADASEVGNALLKILKPKRARTRSTATSVANAADHRDRLWTLLVQRFEGPHGLERAAMHLWGRDAATHVPPLLSFTPAPRAKPADKPTPTP